MNTTQVVIVDPDTSVVQLLNTHLSSTGYAVSSCDNGHDGLKLIGTTEPLIVLADWEAPGLSGLELCSMIRALRPNDAVYVILLTTKAGSAHVPAGTEAGADDYLLKPVKLGELSAQIRTAERVLGLLLEQKHFALELRAVVAAHVSPHDLLQHTTAETKQLTELILSVMIGTDHANRVTAWNAVAESTFGIKSEDVVGQRFSSVPIEWDRAAIARKMAECIATNGPIRLDDVRFKRRDGSDGFLGVTLTPVQSARGRNEGCLFLAADVTKRRVLEEQLAQAQRLESIGRMAAGIVHEINTPTQYIGDNTRFLRDSVAGLLDFIERYTRLVDPASGPGSWDERVAEIKGKIEQLDLDFLKEQIPKAIEQTLEGVERVSMIVRSMKDFAHPGGAVKEPADLKNAIECTIMVARNEWKHVAEMVTNFDPDLPPVPCIAGPLKQAILNIIINAAHSVADVVGEDKAGKGTITVSTRRDQDWAEIRISDTGTGILPEHRSKVFTECFTTKGVGKGTGQGLAIAYAAVTEKHGGTITFETEMGKGTTFIIRLPLESQPATGKEARQDDKACSLIRLPIEPEPATGNEARQDDKASSLRWRKAHGVG